MYKFIRNLAKEENVQLCCQCVIPIIIHTLCVNTRIASCVERTQCAFVQEIVASFRFSNVIIYFKKGRPAGRIFRTWPDVTIFENGLEVCWQPLYIYNNNNNKYYELVVLILFYENIMYNIFNQ